MQDSLSQLLSRYKPSNTTQAIRALREIIQEIVLIGLWRAKFFDHAAFYGGTALRIMYNLNRFSEDLDFSLLLPNSNFSLEPYNDAIKDELEAFGFSVSVETKLKNVDSNIESAFIKANTKTELINIGFGDYTIAGIPKDAKIKIKIEVDTNPPPLFETEIKVLSGPLPISVRCYRESFLFAGKMHAILCRLWKQRTKGRDWYDLVWFICRKTPINLQHLTARLQQNEFLEPNTVLNSSKLLEILKDKILTVDFDSAKTDVAPFIAEPDILSLWNSDYFLALIKGLEFE